MCVSFFPTFHRRPDGRISFAGAKQSMQGGRIAAMVRTTDAIFEQHMLQFSTITAPLATYLCPSNRSERDRGLLKNENNPKIEFSDGATEEFKLNGQHDSLTIGRLFRNK